MPGVGVPVAAEGLPGLLVQGRQVRRRTGVEDDQAGTVLADHLVRERLVGGVGGQGGEGPAEAVAHGTQLLLVARDADHTGAGGDERGGDRAPEAPARAGDDGGLEGVRHRRLRRVEELVRYQDPSPEENPASHAKTGGVICVTARMPPLVRRVERLFHGRRRPAGGAVRLRRGEE
ncbi:hypothetical protein Msi02_14750 [Microbispora siamensis]|uniref:Uncharacterized protein n=1 Tax=Microbispora siamensis TaxID=564413 RepID=A0ABQ4GGV7_9ACTN|nr:hypothetical protein Msi02_14750 [Microbispora siamensis]